MDNKSYELGNANISKLLVKYSTPAIIGMVTNALYNLVDTIVVGKGVGMLAIGGLTISFPIMMLAMAIGQTVGIGSASIISRNMGAGHYDKAYKTAGNGLALSVLLGIAMAVLGSLFMEPLLLLFGATETLLPYAKEYAWIIFLGLPFSAFAMTGNNITRAEGSPFIAMLSMMVGTILNIILDPIFVFVFKLGIAGVAWATIISQFASFAFLAIYFLRGKSKLNIKRQDAYLNKNIVVEICTIGFPSFTRQAAGSLLSIVLNNSLKFYGGDLYISIFGVINRVSMFLLMPLFGIIQGLQPIVGFNYGAGKMNRVKKSLYLSIAAITCMITVGWLVMMIFPGMVIGIFSNDIQLVQEGMPIMRIVAAVLPVIGVQIVGSSYFQAVGKAIPALVLSMSRQILFLMPLLLILPIFLKLNGVWISFPVADLLSTVVTLIWFLKEMKHLTAVHEETEQLKSA